MITKVWVSVYADGCSHSHARMRKRYAHLLRASQDTHTQTCANTPAVRILSKSDCECMPFASTAPVAGVASCATLASATPCAARVAADSPAPSPTQSTGASPPSPPPPAGRAPTAPASYEGLACELGASDGTALRAGVGGWAPQEPPHMPMAWRRLRMVSISRARASFFSCAAKMAWDTCIHQPHIICVHVGAHALPHARHACRTCRRRSMHAHKRPCAQCQHKSPSESPRLLRPARVSGERMELSAVMSQPARGVIGTL